MSVSLLVDIAGGVLVLAGCALLISGGVGLLRFPDFYTRTHASSLTDTAGAALVLVGLLVRVDAWENAVRLVLILAFLMLTGPTAAHALAQAARRDGERVMTDDEEGRR